MKGLFVLIALGALLLIPTNNFAFAQVTDIYFSQEPSPSADEVFSGTPGSNTVTQLTGGGFARINDVEISSCNGNLWWNNWSPGPGNAGPLEGIYSSNLDGSGQVQVTGAAESTTTNGFASGMHGIVLDPANQDVYFTRGVSYSQNFPPTAPAGEVSTVKMDGTGYTKLDAGADSWFPSGIELDSATSTLYWGSPGVILVPFDGAVNTMDTTGGAKAQLNPHVSGHGRSLALDSGSGLVFYSTFADSNPSGNGGIFVHDLSAPNSAINVLPNNPNSGIPDIELDTANSRIYWTEYATGLIRSATYSGTNPLSNIQTEISGLTNPFGLALAFCDDVVAGEMVPIDNAALMLAGIQSISLMIPIAVTAAGIGFVLIRRKI